MKCTVAVRVAVAAAALAVAPAAHAYHEGEERIIDATAHTLRARETRIGIWQVEFAPLAFATIGTDTAPWAASFIVQSVVTNGHVKVQLVRTTPITVSIAAAAYHTQLQESGPLVAGSGSLTLVPLSLFASSDLSRRVSLHLGVTYAHLDFDGDVRLVVGSTPARSALVASALQIHAMGEYRVTRSVALTLQVHGQPYASAPALRIRARSELGGEVDFVGTLKPVDQTSVAAVASVAISGGHFNARFGAGYGAIFVPSMGIMIPITTVFPEIDAYVRF